MKVERCHQNGNRVLMNMTEKVICCFYSEGNEVLKFTSSQPFSGIHWVIYLSFIRERYFIMLPNLLTVQKRKMFYNSAVIKYIVVPNRSYWGRRNTFPSYIISTIYSKNFSSNNINIQGHLKAKLYLCSLLAFTWSVSSLQSYSIVLTCTRLPCNREEVLY